MRCVRVLMVCSQVCIPPEGHAGHVPVPHAREDHPAAGVPAAAAADVHVDEDVDIVLLSADASARSIPSIDIGRIASHRTASPPPRAQCLFRCSARHANLIGAQRAFIARLRLLRRSRVTCDSDL